MAAIVRDETSIEDHRKQLGRVAVKCPKCGAESEMDAARPEKGPKAKCGACGAALEA